MKCQRVNRQATPGITPAVDKWAGAFVGGKVRAGPMSARAAQAVISRRVH